MGRRGAADASGRRGLTARRALLLRPGRWLARFLGSRGGGRCGADFAPPASDPLRAARLLEPVEIAELVDGGRRRARGGIRNPPRPVASGMRRDQEW
jgi:hypothetical protein